MFVQQDPKKIRIICMSGDRRKQFNPVVKTKKCDCCNNNYDFIANVNGKIIRLCTYCKKKLKSLM